MEDSLISSLFILACLQPPPFTSYERRALINSDLDSQASPLSNRNLQTTLAMFCVRRDRGGGRRRRTADVVVSQYLRSGRRFSFFFCQPTSASAASASVSLCFSHSLPPFLLSNHPKSSLSPLTKKTPSLLFAHAHAHAHVEQSSR